MESENTGTVEPEKSTGNKYSSEDLIKDGRNAMLVLCQRCKSKIIQPGKAAFVLTQHFIPFMKPKSDKNDPTEGEVIPKFWQVDDIYTFENVGFSNTVGSTKYLTCADCEIGPIGMHDTFTKISFVALDRVDYRESKEET